MGLWAGRSPAARAECFWLLTRFFKPGKAGGAVCSVRAPPQPERINFAPGAREARGPSTPACEWILRCEGVVFFEDLKIHLGSRLQRARCCDSSSRVLSFLLSSESSLEDPLRCQTSQRAVAKRK